MMRFRTWLVAAIGMAGLLLLIVVSMLTTSRKAQEIYTQLDQLNAHHQEVDTKLRRLRSDVNLSGIFVRDYLLDVVRERAPEYRDRLAQFRQTNNSTVAELLELDAPHAERIRNLETQLDDYWQTFEPLFDWTTGEKIFRSALFLRNEVVPRRDSILAIAQDIEQLNNENLAAQRAEVTRRQAAFREDLHGLLWQTVLVGITVAFVVVLRLRILERRSDEQRAAAEHAEQQMRLLSQERDAAQEEERKHLSRELHDHVAQVLTALRMELGRIERARAPGDARIAAAVAEGKNLIDTMCRTVRDLALGLRPSMLDDLGLQAALEWQVRDYMSRYGANIELTVQGDFDSMPDRHRTCVYRAIQEALTNCMRHAKAGFVKVSVVSFNGMLELSVIDDGIGFDPMRPPAGFGLRGIEERVKELRGFMRVNSGEGKGTTLAIRLPLQVVEVPLARAAG
jgi:signal transduction histidine kinase